MWSEKWETKLLSLWDTLPHPPRMNHWCHFKGDADFLTWWKPYDERRITELSGWNAEPDLKGSLWTGLAHQCQQQLWTLECSPALNLFHSCPLSLLPSLSGVVVVGWMCTITWRRKNSQLFLPPSLWTRVSWPLQCCNVPPTASHIWAQCSLTCCGWAGLSNAILIWHQDQVCSTELLWSPSVGQPLGHHHYPWFVQAWSKLV